MVLKGKGLINTYWLTSRKNPVPWSFK